MSGLKGRLVGFVTCRVWKEGWFRRFNILKFLRTLEYFYRLRILHRTGWIFFGQLLSFQIYLSEFHLHVGFEKKILSLMLILFKFDICLLRNVNIYLPNFITCRVWREGWSGLLHVGFGKKVGLERFNILKFLRILE